MELHRARGAYVRFFAIAQDMVRLGMKLDVKEPACEGSSRKGQLRGQPVGSQSTTRGIDISMRLSNWNKKSSCSKCAAEDSFRGTRPIPKTVWWLICSCHCELWPSIYNPSVFYYIAAMLPPS